MNVLRILLARFILSKIFYTSQKAVSPDCLSFYTDFNTPLCFKADNRFVQKRILSRRTTADVLSHFKGVQRRENSFMYEDIGGFGTEGSITAFMPLCPEECTFAPT